MLDLQEALRRQDTETLVLYLGDDWMEKVYDMVFEDAFRTGYSSGYNDGMDEVHDPSTALAVYL